MERTLRMAYDGTVVVVTGASTGLGRSIAVGAAREGARAVVINFASSGDEARETARLVAEAGAEAVLAQGDVGQLEDCRKVIAAAASYGRIDTLFNNAGVLRPLRPTDLDGETAEDFLVSFQVSVVGTFQMIQAGRTLLEASPRAAVVNTSSLSGVTGLSSSVAYAASKGALNTITKTLARRLAPKIRVNSLCPGFIDTPWFTKDGMDMDLEKMREHMRRITPLQTVGQSDDVAQGALFLGSPASRLTTGETLMADAGLHLG
jgi:NAD(P)-dependent dehydrogenase (short-subunit alcohol dehydrogenase family)